MASDLESDEAKHQVQFRREIVDCIRLHRATPGGTRWSDGLRRSVDILRVLLGRIWGPLARIYGANDKLGGRPCNPWLPDTSAGCTSFTGASWKDGIDCRLPLVARRPEHIVCLLKAAISRSRPPR